MGDRKMGEAGWALVRDGCRDVAEFASVSPCQFPIFLSPIFLSAIFLSLIFLPQFFCR